MNNKSYCKLLTQFLVLKRIFDIFIAYFYIKIEIILNYLTHLTSDIDFLYEVNSIPKDIREKYLTKLMRGKIEGQKNFLFANYVERIVSVDINEWDRERLLRVLKISPKMLACYKCRMLKTLRNNYFGIKRKKNEDDLNFAIRLSKAGMNREARSIFLKVSNGYEREIEIKNYHKIAELSAVYSWLALYYLNLKNYKRFSIYRKKLLLLKKHLYRIDRVSKARLKSEIYKVESYKHIFRLSTYKAQKISVALKLKALKEAKAAKDFEGMLLLMHQIGINHKLNKNYDDAEYYLREGIKLAKKINSADDVIPFRIQLGEIEFNKDNSAAERYHNELNTYIKIFHPGKSPAAILQYSLFNILKTSGFLNLDDDLHKYEKDYCNWLFLTAKRYESNLRSKAQEIIWIGWEMIEWNKEGKYFKVTINEKKLEQYFSTLSVYLKLSKKVYNINRLTLIYNYQADAELYRGKDCNFAAAQVFTDKLERIYKTRKMQIPETWFKLNRILIKMLEESVYTNNEKVYHKHALELGKIIDGMKSKEYKFNVLGDYSKLNFVANIFKVPAFTSEVYSFENWLKENRPNLFEPLNLRENNSALKETA